MFNLFKIKIPKDNAQEITELESWTVKWKVRDNGYESVQTFHKVFVKPEDASEFEKQLKESAKFIYAWISVDSTKN
jgi:hypothetical protein